MHLKPIKFLQLVILVGAMSSQLYDLYDSFQIQTGAPTATMTMYFISDVCQIGVFLLTWKLFFVRSSSTIINAEEQVTIVRLLNALGKYETGPYDHREKWKIKVCSATGFLIFLNFAMGYASPHQKASVIQLTTVVVGNSEKLVDVSWKNLFYYLVYFWTYWGQRACSCTDYFLFVVATTLYGVGRHFAKVFKETTSIAEVR